MKYMVMLLVGSMGLTWGSKTEGGGTPGGGTSGLSQFVGNMKRHLPSMPWRKRKAATAVAQPVPAPVIHDATDKVIMTPNMCKKPFSDTRTKELCAICRNEILRMEQRETIGSKFLSSIIENSAAITAFTSLLTKCQTDPESYKTHVSQETQLRKLVQNDAGSGGVQAEEYIVHFVTKLTQLNCTVPTTP